MNINEIIYSLREIEKDNLKKIEEAKAEGRSEGLRMGIGIVNDINRIINNDIPDIKIDIPSIIVFSEWCYINGIDFSYMTKCPGDDYVKRVVNRFTEYINNTDKTDF